MNVVVFIGFVEITTVGGLQQEYDIISGQAAEFRDWEREKEGMED